MVQRSAALVTLALVAGLAALGSGAATEPASVVAGVSADSAAPAIVRLRGADEADTEAPESATLMSTTLTSATLTSATSATSTTSATSPSPEPESEASNSSALHATALVTLTAPPSSDGEPAPPASGEAPATGDDPASEPDAAERAVPASQPAAKAPRPRLNMSLVDKLYVEARHDEAATVESWLSMNKKLKRAVGNIIGSLVPAALNMSAEAKISSDCQGAVLKWVLSMNQLKSWSLRMLDASGKPIAGLLEGSMTMFGNYRECLKVRAPDDDEIDLSGGEFREFFRGKYCIVQAKPWLPNKSRFYNLNTKLRALMASLEENEDYDKTVMDELSEWALAFNFVNMRMDLCVPSMCSREDIQKVLDFLLGGIEIKARVLRCETEAPNSSSGAVQLESGGAQLADALGAGQAGYGFGSGSGSGPASGSGSGGATEPAAMDTGSGSEAGQQRAGWLAAALGSRSHLGWLLVPVFAVALVLAASLVSCCLEWRVRRRRRHALARSHDEQPQARKQTSCSPEHAHQVAGSRLGRTLQSISLKRSVSSHLAVDYDQLADDKPLALYGVRFLIVLWIILVESAVNLRFEFLRELLSLKELIFWWPMQVIVNSTLQFDSIILLTAFTMAYKNCLSDAGRSARTLARYVADKYVRLMPSIMVMVAMVILLPLAYRGPVWNDYVSGQAAVCHSTGWLNMVFLQNYLPYPQMCLPQTWLVCIELQLVLLLAPLLYALNKSYLSAQKRHQEDSFKPFKQHAAHHQQAHSTTFATRPEDPTRRPLFWLRTWPGLGLLLCMAAGLLGSFYSVYANQLPPSWLYTMADPDSKAIYFGAHLMRLWTHLAVFVLGLLAGLECRRAANNLQRGLTASGRLDPLQQAQRHLASPFGGYFNQNTAGFQSLDNLATCHAAKAQQAPASAGSQSTSTCSLPAAVVQPSHYQHQQQLELDSSCARVDLLAHSYEHINAATSSDHFSSLGAHHAGRSALCKRLLSALWLILVLATMATIIFSTHHWSLNELPEPLVAGLFDAGSRLAWSLALTWILYQLSVPNAPKEAASWQARVTGAAAASRHADFCWLARALGHPAMVCLGKLSFLVYLCHPFVHTTVLAIQEQPIYSSWLMLFHVLIGNLTITVILASLLSLFVEMPCRNLFRRCGHSLLIAQHALDDSSLSNGRQSSLSMA